METVSLTTPSAGRTHNKGRRWFPSFASQESSSRRIQGAKKQVDLWSEKEERACSPQLHHSQPPGRGTLLNFSARQVCPCTHLAPAACPSRETLVSGSIHERQKQRQSFEIKHGAFSHGLPQQMTGIKGTGFFVP